MDSIYSGAATVGRTWAEVSAIFLSVIAVGVIIYGIYLLFNPSNSVQAVVVSTSVNTQTDDTKIPYYSTMMRWEVGAAVIMLPVEGFIRYDTIGEEVTLYYTTDPQVVSIEPNKIWAYWLIGGSAICALVAWIWVWLLRRYKFLAAASGASNVYNLLK